MRFEILPFMTGVCSIQVACKTSLTGRAVALGMALASHFALTFGLTLLHSEWSKLWSFDYSECYRVYFIMWGKAILYVDLSGLVARIQSTLDLSKI